MTCNSICAICLEPNEDGDQVEQICCKKKLHSSCLKQWFKHSPSRTCPLCRQYCNILKIYHINFLENNQYNIIGKLFNNDDNNLSNQVPQAWIDSFNVVSIIPLYTIENKFGEKTFISYYLRQIFLWEEFDSSKLKFIFDCHGKMYLDSTQDFKLCNMDHPAMIIMVEWIHQLMYVLRKEFNFEYLQSLNSLILDLIMATIIKYKINKDMFQSIIIMSVYNTIWTYYNYFRDFKICSEKVINFNELKLFLIEICCGGGFWNNKIILFQQKLIEKHVEMFTDI
jgi:hypothetical protein